MKTYLDYRDDEIKILLEDWLHSAYSERDLPRHGCECFACELARLCDKHLDDIETRT